VKIYGQLEHKGHEKEKNHVPLPDRVKETIGELLRELHRVEDIPAIVRQCIHL
jgi:hypothetical protein